MTEDRIKADALTAEKYVMVKGEIAFSHIRSLLSPDEINTMNIRMNSKYPVSTSAQITTISLNNVELIQADPAGMSIEEQYVFSRFYSSEKNPEYGRRYSITNYGKYLPSLMVQSFDPNGNAVAVPVADESIPDKEGQPPVEPSPGQSVTLLLRTYANRSNKVGLGINAVIFAEEPKWGLDAGGVNRDALARYGLTMQGVPTQHIGQVYAAPQQQSQPQASQQFASAGYPAQAPAQQLPPNTVVNPTTGYAGPAPVIAAPVANAAYPQQNAQVQPQASQQFASGGYPAPVQQSAQPPVNQMAQTINSQFAAQNQAQPGTSPFNGNQTASDVSPFGDTPTVAVPPTEVAQTSVTSPWNV